MQLIFFLDPDPLFTWHYVDVASGVSSGPQWDFYFKQTLLPSPDPGTQMVDVLRSTVDTVERRRFR